MTLIGLPLLALAWAVTASWLLVELIGDTR